MICFKVVGHDLTSVCNGFLHEDWSKWSIQYKVGEWIEPKQGRLFVYRNCEDAIEFALSYKSIGPFHVYKVEASGICRIVPITGQLEDMDIIVRAISNKKKIPTDCLLPFYKNIMKSTTAVKRVKLIERVW